MAPDAVLWVVVTQDVDAGEVDGNEAHVSLVADSLDSTAPFAPVVGDGDGNDADATVVENVLGDGSGTGNEADNDGAHSATGAYIVASATVSGSKAVTVHTEDGSNCTTIPGTSTGGYYTPGACVEYVISCLLYTSPSPRDA